MLIYYSLLFYLSLTNAATKEEPAPEPCTIRSPTSHSFYDLNPLHIISSESGQKKIPASKGLARDHSWNATGYDVNYNFTMNFCGGVVEQLEDVVGVDKSMWGNVSAYYRQGGKVYSIGQQNSVPVFRGRKLVLNYTNGSPCDLNSRKRAQIGEDFSDREIVDHDGKKKHEDDEDDEDDDDKGSDKNPSSATRRKSSVISLLCDKDPLASLLTLSYVGASPDECTYFFEARSSAACAGVETAKQTLSPSGVFGVIAVIAVIVYVVGGCAYSRMVLNQRGWRQLPNYSLWAGIFGFVQDMFVILTSSCARFLPNRQGYHRVNGNANGYTRGRSRGDSDAENRLIDELNEEWED